MKKIIMILAFVSITLPASADSKKLLVEEVKSDSEIVVKDAKDNRWIIEVGTLCFGLSRYENKMVIGDYHSDPTALFAKIKLPGEQMPCSIESARKL